MEKNLSDYSEESENEEIEEEKNNLLGKKDQK
jgi:hypothetical protein